MPITKRELKEILNKLGFTEIRSKHHIFFELRISNRIIRTKISHGSEKDIGDALLSHSDKYVATNGTEIFYLIDFP